MRDRQETSLEVQWLRKDSVLLMQRREFDLWSGK